MMGRQKGYKKETWEGKNIAHGISRIHKGDEKETERRHDPWANLAGSRKGVEMSNNEGPPPAPGASPVVRGVGSAAGEIRERLPWIEAQRRAGRSLAQIAEALREAGVAINHLNLKQSLYRARKKGGGRQVGAPAAEAGSDRQVAVVPAAQPVASAASVESAEGEVSPPPPQAAVQHMTMEEAMDPRKRAAFADQFLKREPLVIKPKQKSGQ